MAKTYLVPRYDYNDHFNHWDAWIEEREASEANTVIFAWHIREAATAHEALEAVTTEYVRMCSKIIYSEV